MTVVNKLTALLEPLVTELGYEFVGIEYQTGGAGLLRVYIDRPEEGIGLEDCELVSREVSALLDVEDPISGEYTLEVSSPGMNRPLFGYRDFMRFKGERVKASTMAPVDGRRRFRGELKEASETSVVIEVEGERYTLDLNNIGKARLDPEW